MVLFGPIPPMRVESGESWTSHQHDIQYLSLLGMPRGHCAFMNHWYWTCSVLLPINHPTEAEESGKQEMRATTKVVRTVALGGNRVTWGV